MAKKLLIVAAFLTLLFAGDRLGAFVLGVILDHSNVPLAQMYAGRLESDVVLLGDSRAYRHFETKVLSREFGVPVANLSAPGGSTMLSLVLLGDFIDIYGPPKVVMYELNDLSAIKENVVLRPFTRRTKRMSNLIRESAPGDYYVGEISHLFSFNNTYFLNAVHKVFNPIPQLIRPGALTEPISPDELASWQGDYFRLKAENAIALRSIIELAERHGILLHLIISPTLPAFAERNGFLAWRKEISKEIGEIPIWDYGTRPPLAPEFFSDPSHLNVRGVDTFMNLLRHDGFFELARRRLRS